MPIYAPNTKKQTPVKVDGRRKYSTANTPDAETVVKRPSYVMINQTGSYAFSYYSGSAVPGNATHNYQTGSVTHTLAVVNDQAGTTITPFRLDINPVAWRRIDGGAAKGQVTFVYVRVM